MDTSARRTWPRLLLVIPAAALLVLGLVAGLLLMGLSLPMPSARLPELHSALMVFGFVGTLISLERAVALRKPWPYAAPVFLAAGTFLALSPAPVIIGQGAIAVGMAVHVLQYRAIWARQPMTAITIQGIGAVTGLVAAIVWCGGVPAPRLVPLLAIFLVLTIAGERLELARIAAPGIRAERVLFALALAAAVATMVSLTMPVVAIPVAGVVLLAVVAWLVRFDVARATVRMPGLPRYVAVCLLIGYGWLAFAGAGWVLGGARTEGVIYDATTHAIFLGFVITMIMAHAPVILPAVLGVRIPYHRALYVPVALLQLSLLLRVVVGDAWGVTAGLQAGGIGAAVAGLGFGATVVVLSLRARSSSGRAATASTEKGHGRVSA